MTGWVKGIEERQEEGERRRRRKTDTQEKDWDAREGDVKIIKKTTGRVW